MAKREQTDRTSHRPLFTVADSSHSDLLFELMQEFYALEHLRFEEPTRRALERLLDDRALGMVHLICSRDAVIGYFILTFGFSLEFHGRDALVDELYIREPYRGEGIGQASLRFIEALCRQHGIEALHLEVDRSNLRAQALYRRAGYQDHDRYLLTKWLRDSLSI